jgi:hypothetical protein
MRYAVLGFCLTVTCLIVQPAQAQVHVNIGINPGVKNESDLDRGQSHMMLGLPVVLPE